MKSRIILGISFGHGDSSAALIVDGCLVAAAEEERFTRVKHYALFPENAIRYCLQHSGVEAKSVDVLAIPRRPWDHLTRRILLLWQHPYLFKFSRGNFFKSRSLKDFTHSVGLNRAKIVRVEHHTAHLMSARILSASFDMALLSFDGLGDFVSASIGRPQGEGVEVLSRVFYPNSLGHFYSAMTQYLGFPHFGDEFKVMGLSSLGKPVFLSQMRQLVVEEHSSFGFRLNLEAFPVWRSAKAFSVENGQPKIKPFFNKNLLTQMLGIPPRKPYEPLTEKHYDLAKSVQIRFEEVATHLLNQLHKKVPHETLALAGGCAHNSVWVGKIPELTPFKQVLVAPAAHDAGIAVGAAAWGAQTRVTVEGGHWGLLGPQDNEPVPIQRKPTNAKKCWEEKSFSTDEALIQWLVEEISQKHIVGLFRGRMEFGPRALGSRSILADPRWDGMKNKLNERVKHRETFRPFAASVLWEHQQEWFENSFFSPSMEAVFTVKNGKKIPAVTHADNSCRIQSVTKEHQPFYWELIESFRRKTGVPMLLNTSFNDCEPIVCTEADAWECFLNTEMDCLVIGTHAFRKTEGPHR